MEIERVPFETRIEKRLAALLADLARHKNMTLAEMLEETFLHTFEKVPGGGVASPHTGKTLAYIQELSGSMASTMTLTRAIGLPKRKNGIDGGTFNLQYPPRINHGWTPISGRARHSVRASSWSDKTSLTAEAQRRRERHRIFQPRMTRINTDGLRFRVGRVTPRAPSRGPTRLSPTAEAQRNDIGFFNHGWAPMNADFCSRLSTINHRPP